MVESDRHEGPATHALTFVWTGQEVTDDFQCDESVGILLNGIGNL